MAFVRSKIIDGHTYYYLVRSVREGKKVRQEHLEYLGKVKGVPPTVPYEKKEEAVVEETKAPVRGTDRVIYEGQEMTVEYLETILLQDYKHDLSIADSEYENPEDMLRHMESPQDIAEEDDAEMQTGITLRKEYYDRKRRIWEDWVKNKTLYEAIWNNPGGPENRKVFRFKERIDSWFRKEKPGAVEGAQFKVIKHGAKGSRITRKGSLLTKYGPTFKKESKLPWHGGLGDENRYTGATIHGDFTCPQCKGIVHGEAIRTGSAYSDSRGRYWDERCLRYRFKKDLKKSIRKQGDFALSEKFEVTDKDWEEHMKYRSYNIVFVKAPKRYD